MSKPIKVTDCILEDMIEKMKQDMLGKKFSKGIFEYKQAFVMKDETKVTITFSQLAWMKLKLLVAHNDKEIGWNGFVDRIDETNFFIQDIIVYPQSVTGTTCEEDEEKMMVWRMQISDEDYPRMRFHGHSHVNMGVTPSGVDESYYKKILDQISDNDYYIFGVFNKRGAYTLMVYDMKTNTLYENADIVLQIEGFDIDQFLKESDEKVKPKVYNTTKSTYTAPSNKWKNVYSAPTSKNTNLMGTVDLKSREDPVEDFDFEYGEVLDAMYRSGEVRKNDLKDMVLDGEITETEYKRVTGEEYNEYFLWDDNDDYWK